MIRRLLVTLVAFVTVFLTQSQAWAAVNSADKVSQSINVSIDKSTFLAADEAPAIIAKRMGDGGTASYVWIASIFIAGLGQILMGDLWRGLKFTLLTYGIPIVVGVVLGVIGGVLTAGAVSSGNASGAAGIVGIFSILGIVAWVAGLVFYVWNIIDAYNMSQETAGMSKLNSEELAKLEKDLKATVAFVNSTKVSDNGTVSVRAFAF